MLWLTGSSSVREWWAIYFSSFRYMLNLVLSSRTRGGHVCGVCTPRPSSCRTMVFGRQKGSVQQVVSQQICEIVSTFGFSIYQLHTKIASPMIFFSINGVRLEEFRKLIDAGALVSAKNRLPRTVGPLHKLSSNWAEYSTLAHSVYHHSV